MKNILIIVVSFYFLSSCIATHMGTISTSSVGRTVSYEDIAFGVSQTERFFGLGGAGQDAMVLEAKRELIKNRPLQANEEYLNYTLDYKNTYWPFYRQTKVTMSADVVRFIDEPINEPFSEKYKSKLLGKNISNSLFNIGDTIAYLDLKQGVISSFHNAEIVRVVYKTKKDKIKSRKTSINEIYTQNGSFKGYKAGDNYVYNEVVYGVEHPKVFKIVAVGLKSMLVEDSSREIKVINYN